MQTVFLCHAKEDHELSRELTEFLERGAGFQVFLQDGEIAEDENIVSKAVDGLQAEVILLVLSPCSVPERWVRAEWEPALFDEPKRAGVKVGTILAGQCEFPPLLRRASRSIWDMSPTSSRRLSRSRSRKCSSSRLVRPA